MSAWSAHKTWVSSWRSTLDEFTGLVQQHYSLTEPSWIAFGAGCLCFWVAVWQYGYDSVHSVHGAVITAMSLASLAHLISEEAVFLFSLTYFCLDAVDSVRVGKYLMLLAHHVPTLGLFGAVVAFPNMLTSRYASKILIVEITTPFLERWRSSKSKGDFKVLMAFYLFRVCYMSWLVVQLHNDIGSWVSWIANCLLALNLFWFSQQVWMLFNYKEKNVGKENPAEDMYSQGNKAD